MSDTVFAKAAAWFLPHIGGLIGAIIALSFLDDLTRRGKIAAVLIGSTTAYFVGPVMHDVIAHWLPPVQAGRLMSLCSFAVGLCAMAVLPGFVRWLQRGSKNGELFGWAITRKTGGERE